MTQVPNPHDALHRRGLMFILSSPSGAGKTTIARKLLAAEPELGLSVSATTRPIRPGEIDGRDYHFISQDTFDRKVEEGEFYEWAHVFGNCYGTPKGEIRAGLKVGSDYLFDIDWQGTQQLHAAMGEDLVRVFILPPSMTELERRLTTRGTDSAETIDGRMARAAGEISHWAEYDYVLINEDPAICLAQVRAILSAERLKRWRQGGLVAFVRDLVSPR